MSDIDRTAVYRMFSRQGDLLYVGITKSLAARLGQHDTGKDWYHLVDSIKLAHYPTRDQARRAEIMAIQKESPAFNIADRAEGDPPRFAEYGIEHRTAVPKGMHVMGGSTHDIRAGRPCRVLPDSLALFRVVAPDPGIPFHFKTLKSTVREIAAKNGLEVL